MSKDFNKNHALERRNNTGLTIWDLFNRPLNSFGDYLPTMKAFESVTTDVKDCGDHYEVTMDLPGVKKEDIKVDFSDDVLTISAAHNQEEESREEQQKYLLRERVSGTYVRRLSFGDVDPARIDAVFEQGVLKVTLGKAQQSGHQITVK